MCVYHTVIIQSSMDGGPAFLPSRPIPTQFSWAHSTPSSEPSAVPPIATRGHTGSRRQTGCSTGWFVGGRGTWSPAFCTRNVHPKHADKRGAGSGKSHGTAGSASNGKKGGHQGGRGHPCNPSPTHTNRRLPPTASPPAVLQRE